MAVDQKQQQEQSANGAGDAQAEKPKPEAPSLEVELARDTVTFPDKTTGLAGVLVQMDSVALGDDIADIALDAAARKTQPGNDGKRHYTFRVFSEPTALGDIDVYKLLEGRLKNLVNRVEAYAPAPKQDGKKRDEDKDKRRAMLATGTAIGAGVQALGLASKLFARDYHRSGKEVPAKDLGFDLLVAKKLKRKARDDEDVTVEVTRVLPTVETKIAKSLWDLAGSVQSQVIPKVATDAKSLAEAAASATVAEGSITALDNQIIEVTKLLQHDVKDVLDDLVNRRKDAAESMPGLKAEEAQAREKHVLGEAIVKDVQDLLTFALSSPAKGGPAPIVQAARAEGLMSEHGGGKSHLLYARLIQAGIDDTIETKLGPDSWTGLAGASAEYCLLAPDRKLLTCGVRSALEASWMKLSDPKTFDQRRLDYTPTERVTARNLEA